MSRRERGRKEKDWIGYLLDCTNGDAGIGVHLPINWNLHSEHSWVSSLQSWTRIHITSLLASPVCRLRVLVGFIIMWNNSYNKFHSRYKYICVYVFVNIDCLIQQQSQLFNGCFCYSLIWLMFVLLVRTDQAMLWWKTPKSQLLKLIKCISCLLYKTTLWWQWVACSL